MQRDLQIDCAPVSGYRSRWASIVSFLTWPVFAGVVGLIGYGIKESQTVRTHTTVSKNKSICYTETSNELSSNIYLVFSGFS